MEDLFFKTLLKTDKSLHRLDDQGFKYTRYIILDCSCIIRVEISYVLTVLNLSG